MSSSSNHDQSFLPFEAKRQPSRIRNKKLVSSSTDNATKRQHTTHTHWKSEGRQRLYSSKLMEAMAQISSSSVRPDQRRGRAVREAADHALAAASGGRTLWSRAILTKRKPKFRKKQKKLRNQRLSSVGSGKQSATEVVLKGKRQKGAVQRKARVLGRLVPGCKKQTLPIILEETTDYITALEMQIRTMTALAELLSCRPITNSSA